MNIAKFKLEEYLSKYEFKAKYLLCCSDAESFAMDEILDFASIEEKKLWSSLRLGYTEVRGAPALRDTIASTLYPKLNSENIMTFAGAEEGIFCALSTIVESNDHVIVLTPCYQSLFEIPAMKGAEISEIMLEEKNNWQIDINKIKSVIKKNTKCIIINFPHNPTGAVITQFQLEQCIEICKKNNLWLFSDEVYRLLGAPAESFAQPAAVLYDKALSLGVMSKAYGMAGLRVGWIATKNLEILNKIEYCKHYTSICNSAPSEILSMIALRNSSEILKRNNLIVQSNLKLLEEFFIEYKNLFEWVKPGGGCVGFVKYKGADSIDNFCTELVKQQNVLLLPGVVFNYSGNYFRIGFGRSNMPIALNELKKFLSINKK